jgi:hypothetical protein
MRLETTEPDLAMGVLDVDPLQAVGSENVSFRSPSKQGLPNLAGLMLIV